jgi:transposase InsO family protein
MAGGALSKFSRWDRRLGTPNRHNAPVPRSFWLEDWEKAAIVAFQDRYPLEGYRRLAYMMRDADVVAVSPSSVYRVLKAAGKLAPRGGKPSRKGGGFEQPTRPHEHWHADVSCINICGIFYYLCSLLDGYSRFLVHWEIGASMTERDVQTIAQRARERFPGARPRIISDNGPQFVSWEFKQFIRLCGMTHVRTSPYYPQSNGKMERWFQTAKPRETRHERGLIGSRAGIARCSRGLCRGQKRSVVRSGRRSDGAGAPAAATVQFFVEITA